MSTFEGLLDGAPTPQAQWVRAGDRCVSANGASGTVLRIVEVLSIPYAVVRWDSGAVGRHSITTLKKQVTTSGLGLIYPVLPE